MAKTAIGSADLALLRSNHHYIDDVRLNIFRPETVATATIDDTPSDNPVSSIVVTGDVSSTEIGQRFIIRDSSSNLVAHGTLRKATSSQTLNISPISIGNSGYVSPIKRAIQSGDTITIYQDRPLWGDYSRIVSGNFRKKWDVAYTDENEDAPPIANAGTSQSIRVESGTASFTLPKSGSNDSFAFGSKTISTYLWTLPSGVTLKGGYATSDAVIEVDATIGQHILSLTITDSNSKVHTAYVYLFVSDGSTYSDLFDQYAVQITGDSQDINGRTLTFTVTGEELADTILPASYVHLQHETKYNGSSLTSGVDVDTFVGYITEYQYTHNGDYGQAFITAISPYLYCQRVFMPSQLITEVSNPNNWTQVNSDLSNPRGALCYIRWQCQNLFSMHDIDANGITTPRKLSYEYNSKTLAGGLDVSAQALVGNVGSASDGTLVLRHNPNYENNTFRNSLAVGMTFSADDLTPPLEHPISTNPPYADIRAGAFAYNGGGVSGVKAWYGVKRWEQGASETVLPDFTVDKTDGLDTVLEKVGHIASEQNYPHEQPLTFNGIINVIDPAYMIWFRLSVTDDYDASGDGWDNVRILPRRVNRTWNNETGQLAIQATVKRETFGQVADQWIPGSGTTVVSGGWVSELPINYTPTDINFSVLPSNAIAYNTTGDLGITYNFGNTSPVWDSLNDFVTGNVNDVCYDYNSTFFSSGFLLSEPLSIYIVTTSSTSLFVYRLYDIKSPTVEITLLTTYTMADASNTSNARIQCSKTTPTLAVAAWHDQTGVEFGRTTDGGSTWSSKANVGDAITDTANDNAPIGFYISGTNQVITAPNSSNEYGTYLATTAGGSFSKLSNSEDNNAPNTMITGDDNTTIYVATENDGSGGSPDYTVDFDGGYSSFTVSEQGGELSGAGSGYGGNGGGNAAGVVEANTGNMLSVNTQFIVEITFDPDITLAQIDADFYFDVDWSGRVGASNDLVRFVVSAVKTLPSTSTPADSGHVLDSDTVNAEGENYVFVNSQTWLTKTFTWSTPVTCDTLEVKMDTTGSVGLWTVDNTTTGCFRMDNIKIYETAGGSPIDPALYKVTTYTTTDSWTDITDSDYVPQLPYSLKTDIANASNIEMVGYDGTDTHYLQSDDTGSTFTDNGASDYRALTRVSNFIIYGGDDALDISIDSGATVIDKRGNLDVVFDGIGVIKNVLVLV